MQRFATTLFRAALAAVVLTLAAHTADAQRRVVIEPGPPGTFNNTITNDVNADGSRVDPNTTYVLRRGARYLYTAQLVNQGYPLTIVAEDGTGAKPILQAAGNPGTEAPRPFRAGGNLTLKNLYIYGVDDLGVSTDNATVRIEAENVRVDLDGIVFGSNRLSTVRINKDGGTVNIRNCVFGYIFNLNSASAWVFRVGTGVQADTLRVTNSTFYNNEGLIFLNQGSTNLVDFRHNTFHNTGGSPNFSDAIDAGVTNKFIFRDNLAYNTGYYGASPLRNNPLDPRLAVVGVDTVFVDNDNDPSTPSVAQPFDIDIANLNLYLDPAISASYPDSVTVRQTYNAPVQAYFGANPDRAAGVFSEALAFTRPPSTQAVIDRLRFFYQNQTTQGAPFLDGDPRAPQNTPATPPRTNAEQVPFDFSYPTSTRSYAAATGGCPLGDLNWFPSRYAACTAAGAVANQSGPVRVGELRVQPPAPNPASMTSTIRFDLAEASDVSVALYDVLGRRVLQTDAAMGAGEGQSVGLDVSALPSGVYVYRLRAVSGGAVSQATGRLTVTR